MMNFYSQKIILFTLSLLAAQSVVANTEWIGVECTYLPSDQSEMKQRTEKTETNNTATSASIGKAAVAGASANTNTESAASASAGITGTGTAKSSNTEQSTVTEKNLYEIKHKFYINEASEYIKDAEKNNIGGAVFENDKINFKMNSARGSYRIILFRNGYNSSILFIQSEANAPSHYSGKCHSIILQNDDISPNHAYPSSNRGF